MIWMQMMVYGEHIMKKSDAEELTTSVMKYMLRDLDKKIEDTHNETIDKFSKLEAKLDALSKLVAENNTLNSTEHIGLKKDNEYLAKRVDFLQAGLFAVGIAVVGGLVKLVFDLFTHK